MQFSDDKFPLHLLMSVEIELFSKLHMVATIIISFLVAHHQYC